MEAWWFQNWEELVKIFGIGVLFLGLFIWKSLQYSKLKSQYLELTHKLYEHAYKIALQVLDETLKTERGERIHSREEWERRTNELIGELKKERGR